jgi:hypothetical protein
MPQRLDTEDRDAAHEDAGGNGDDGAKCGRGA